MGRLMRAIVAGVVLAVVLVAFPWVFLQVGVANPGHLPSAGEVSGWLAAPLAMESVLRLLVMVAWVLWAWFVVCLLVELLNLARARRSASPLTLPFSGVPQHLARRLLTALLLVGVSATGVAGAAAAAPVAATSSTNVRVASLERDAVDPLNSTLQPLGATMRNESSPAPGPAAAVIASPSASAVPDGVRRAVVHAPHNGQYDCLWDMAEQHLGDGARWKEIYELNRTPVPGGVVITDPDLIYVGTHVRMPAEAKDLPLWSDGSTTQGPDVTGRDRAGAGAAQTSPAAPAPSSGASSAAPNSAPGSSTTAAPSTSAQGPSAGSIPQRGPVGASSSGPSASAPATSAASSLSSPAGAPSAPHTMTGRPGTAQPTSPVEAGAADRATTGQPDQQSEGSDGAHSGAGGLYAGLGATGSALLAGCVLLALRAQRRRQLRHRQPGRAVAEVDAPLRPVERALMTHGAGGLADAAFLDGALRALAAAVQGRSLGDTPDVIAARLDDEGVALRLLRPLETAPEPWVSSEGGTWWCLPASAAPAVTDEVAPYPALASIGHHEQERWLLDLERAQSVRVHGDPERCAALARYMAAELALNTWSEQVRVTMLGFGAELVGLAPHRLRFVAATAQAVADVAEELATAEELTQSEGDALGQRLDPDALDLRVPHIVLVGATVGDDAALSAQLSTALGRHDGRTGAAVVFTTREDSDLPGTGVRVDSTGMLRIDELDLSITAHALSEAEAAGIAGLLAATRQLQDQQMPSYEGSQPWARFATTDGALRAEYVTPRRSGVDAASIPDLPVALDGIDDAQADTINGVPGASLLPEPDQAYLATSAATTDDLAVLAPRTAPQTRARVEDADPTLDTEVEAWFDEDSRIPKLTILGPLTLNAQGAPEGRVGFLTELITFLAMRPMGATTEEIAAAFAISTTTVRKRLHEARAWLGDHPVTGAPILPDSRKTAQAEVRGVPVYALEGILVDADLFRRLRLRGQARGGAQGMADLERALEFVTGEPFSQARAGGCLWLTEGDRIDQVLVMAVADVAHLVATSYLQDEDPQGAQRAVESGLKADPYSETMRLDMAAAREMLMDKASAERYLRRHVTDRSDDAGAPEDLPGRTGAVLAQRAWFGAAEDSA